jgi:hypothetical protein
MSTQTYDLQILVYEATLNSSTWATLSLAVAADNSVKGSFGYLGPAIELTGSRSPGSAGAQDNYELDGEEVSIRLSSYPAFGAQFPVAGVASINEAGPFYMIGKKS